MNHGNCQMLFEASQALVDKSGLAKYHGFDFIACDNQAAFNEFWKDEFHPTFGRYMAWVLFSVGAENLAKAACVCNGVKVSSTATLSAYTRSEGYFRMLCKETGLCNADEGTLQRGYKRLGKVRNRDAHSYHNDVRSSDFPLVEQTFVPAFNIAVEAMKRGSHSMPKSS